MPIRLDGDNATATPGITGGDADTGLVFGTNEIEAVTGGTTRFTVESNGNVTIENGNLVLASGSGIDFSATADSSATMQNELLDDYEEGIWTPFYDTEATSSTAISYSNQTGGSYIKIGRVVYICGRVRTENSQSLDGSGNILLKGLPFAISSGFDSSSDTQDCSAVFSVQQVDGWNDGPTVMLGQEGFTHINLFKGATFSTPVAVGDFKTASSAAFNRMRFSGFYFTDS